MLRCKSCTKANAFDFTASEISQWTTYLILVMDESRGLGTKVFDQAGNHRFPSLRALQTEEGEKPLPTLPTTWFALDVGIVQRATPRAVTKDKLAERRSGSQFELLKPDPHMLLVKLLHMVSHVHVCRAGGQTGQINRKHAVSPVNCQRLLVGTSHRFSPQIINLGNLLGKKKTCKVWTCKE